MKMSLTTFLMLRDSIKEEQLRQKNSKLKLHHNKDNENEEELDFRQKYYDGTIAGLIGCLVESIFYANYRNK